LAVTNPTSSRLICNHKYILHSIKETSKGRAQISAAPS
jgi:hypothetical protein